MNRLLFVFQIFFICLISGAVLTGCAHRASSELESQAKALLDEAGHPYEFDGCYKSDAAREIYCSVNISPDLVNYFVFKLDLHTKLPNFDREVRIITLDGNQDPDSPDLRKIFRRAFSIPQWVPARNGFASSILFYNRKTGDGCLYLSVAYDRK